METKNEVNKFEIFYIQTAIWWEGVLKCLERGCVWRNFETTLKDISLDEILQYREKVNSFSDPKSAEVSAYFTVTHAVPPKVFLEKMRKYLKKEKNRAYREFLERLKY